MTTAARVGPGRWRPTSAHVDGALAVAILAAGAGHVVLTGTRSPVTLGSIVVMALALLVRRHAPVPAAAVCVAAFALTLAVEDEPTLLQVGPMIALYFVGQALGTRASIAVAMSCALVGLAVWTLYGSESVQFVLGTLLVIVPLAVGRTVADRRRYVAELQARLDAVVAARSSEVARLVLEDRLAMSRELHDIIAHTVAVVNVQASVALQHTLGNEPATTALTAIRSSSAQALDELRSVLGLLRRRDDAPEPASAARALPALVESAAGPDLAVTLTADAEQLADLERDAPAVLLVAHRIIQEGLTNVLRHSAARTARVALEVTDRQCRVEVVDPGPTRAEATTGLGSGLDGLRERVTLHRGTMIAGHRDDGGFRVHAEIPLRPSR